jgi:hypothetical protein
VKSRNGLFKRLLHVTRYQIQALSDFIWLSPVDVPNPIRWNVAATKKTIPGISHISIGQPKFNLSRTIFVYVCHTPTT